MMPGDKQLTTHMSYRTGPLPLQDIAFSEVVEVDIYTIYRVSLGNKNKM